MTPKQQYEARKAERKKLEEMDRQIRQRTEKIMLLDMVDRFVTAAERIADALERPQFAPASGMVFDPKFRKRVQGRKFIRKVASNPGQG
jgi:hypothetical protein